MGSVLHSFDETWKHRRAYYFRTIRAMKRLLWRVQGGLCSICGETMPLVDTWVDPIHRGTRPSIDHVIPRTLGGPEGVGNVTCAHVDCNTAKAHRPPTGCEMIWLLAVNARLGVEPTRW